MSTGENLNEPQILPENWGPIFGLSNFKDKLGDLSWCNLSDQGWFEVGPAPEPEPEDPKKIVDSQIQHLLNESLPMVASDNTLMTKQQRIEWSEYRQKLKEIYLQVGYPNNIFWPKRPD